MAGGHEVWSWPWKHLWGSLQTQLTSLCMYPLVGETHAWKAALENLSDIISMSLHIYLTFCCSNRVRKTHKRGSTWENQPVGLKLGWAVWEQSKRISETLGDRKRQEVKGSFPLSWTDFSTLLYVWVSYLTFLYKCINFSNFKYWCNIYASSSKRCFCGLWSIFPYKL